MLENFINNKDLTKKTKQVYIANLRKLNNFKPLEDDLTFLTNYNGIHKFLQAYSYQTQRSILTSIVVLLEEVVKRDNNYDYLYNYWKEFFAGFQSSPTMLNH